MTVRVNENVVDKEQEKDVGNDNDTVEDMLNKVTAIKKTCQRC